MSKAFEQFQTATPDRAGRLLAVTAAIADAITAEEVFGALVDCVLDAVDASSAGLWLVDAPNGTAKLVRSRGYSEAAAQALATVPLDESPSIPALDSIKHGAAVWIGSQADLIERYPHLSAVATQGRRYRVSCLPLMAHGRILGVLALTIEEERQPTEGEKDFLLLIARYASQAIERLSLFEAERRSRAEADAAATRLAVLGHASRAFAESNLDLQSRLRAVASELMRAFGSCINIGLLEADGLLHLRAVQHPNPQADAVLQALTPTLPLRLGVGITGALAANGKSVLLPCLDQDATLAAAAPEYREFIQRYPVFAMIGAVMRLQGRVIGTVTATRCEKGETYTPKDLEMLEELADRAAAAIENSRLYQETLDARSRAEQLYGFAEAVLAADKVEVVYDAALYAVEAALGAVRSAVLTFDQNGVMTFRAWHNLSDPYRAAVTGHSPWPADAKSAEPLLIEDAERDPNMASYVPIFRREGIRALAFIPLMTGGRLVGKFMIYFDRPHRFAPHDIATARAIGNHLASVIMRFAAVANLEETIRYNELFAGILGHDLRNPLGAIVSAAQLVLARGEEENAIANRPTRPLSVILSSSQRMTTMIDQLLDFTRARSGGGIRVQPRATNLAELCAQAIDELQLTHPEWKIRCEVVGDPCGSWDSDRLLQVISNLVANAGQHGTPDAGITVKLHCADPDQVTMAIHNHGAIPESLLREIFDPFRSTRHTRDHSRGLGLGLFIVREIVRSHGGTVGVTSSEVEGTTFTILLPRNTVRRDAR